MMAQQQQQYAMQDPNAMYRQGFANDNQGLPNLRNFAEQRMQGSQMFPQNTYYDDRRPPPSR